MIIGDKTRFAIESGITEAFMRLSFRALGFFVIYIKDRRYGVYAPDATMIACSFDEVSRRIGRRGIHTAPFTTDPDAAGIADAYLDAIYAPDHEDKYFFGIPLDEFKSLFYSHHLVWAPDGDEAFDDRSHVLHFDVGDRVRLIAFTSRKTGYHHAPSTLTDIWLEASEFYGILEQWRQTFEGEWTAAPKISETEDGAENM